MLGGYCAISIFTQSMAISSAEPRNYVYLVYMLRKGGGSGFVDRVRAGRKSLTGPADYQGLLCRYGMPQCGILFDRGAVYPAEMSRKMYTICGKAR
jgi:hypothetical protein